MRVMSCSCLACSLLKHESDNIRMLLPVRETKPLVFVLDQIDDVKEANNNAVPVLRLG